MIDTGMQNIAIRADSLGKRYRIEKKQQRHTTLHDALLDTLSAPFRVLHRFSLSTQPSSPDHIWALKNVSFEIRRGEIVGFIGRNGSGKSTLLKILSRITDPTEGRVEIYGRVGALLETGLGFHPELTGRENIALNGAILGMSKAEINRKFDEIVAFSGVEKFLDTPVKRYSSGMRVRLAFAVAAHLEPEILLVDEVLAVGDAEFRRKCLGKLREVASEGKTVLFISHNLTVLQDLCSRAFAMEAGQIVGSGTVTEVVDRYLLSDRQDNVFLHSCANRVGGERVRIIDFWVRPVPPKTGMPVEFAFIISRAVTESDLRVELTLSIVTEQGTPLLQLHSRNRNHGFVLSKDTTRITARLDRLPLTPGRYLVNLELASGTTPIDWLRECFVLKIEEEWVDGYEGVQYTKYPVIIPSSWKEY